LRNFSLTVPLFRKLTGQAIAPDPQERARAALAREAGKREAYQGENLLDASDSDISDKESDLRMDVDSATSLAAKMRLQSSSSSVFENSAQITDLTLHPLQQRALSSDKCPLPDEYIRARTARRFDAEPQALGGIGPLTRSGEVGEMATKSFSCGNFDSIPDKRLGEVFKVHSVARCSNYTLSFDPEKLECTACKDPHPILVEKKPTCIILADQNFPPT